MAADLAAKARGFNWQIETANSNQKLDHKIRDEWSTYKIQIPSRIDLTEILPGTWENSQDLILRNLLSLKGNFDFLFSDGKSPWSFEQWEMLKCKFAHIIPIDNIYSLDAAVDGSIFPIDYFCQMGLAVKGKVWTGPEWVWIHPASRKVQRSSNPQYLYGIQMGGADPGNLTLKALGDLQAQKVPLDQVLVLLGPSYTHWKSLELWLRNAKSQPKIEMTGVSLHEKLADCKVLLCAFGLVAVESQYIGIPIVLFGHNPEHEKDLQTYLSARPRLALSRPDWLAGKKFPILKGTIERPDIGDALRKIILEKIE